MNTRPSNQAVYWWRVPDIEDVLMGLRPAELKCYLVITRAIQRDRNAGKLSIRQIAERARVGKRHVEEAIASLLSRGLLNCKTRPGATAAYSLPAAWKGDSCPPEGGQSADEIGANRTPVGGQLEVAGGQHLPPTGGQDCPPVGGQHLESSEKVESSSKSSTVARPVSRERGGTTTSPVESQTPNPKRWWTPEELQEARRAIAQHLGRGHVPDERVTSQVLVALRNMFEFRLWLGDPSANNRAQLPLSS